MRNTAEILRSAITLLTFFRRPRGQNLQFPSLCFSTAGFPTLAKKKSAMRNKEFKTLLFTFHHHLGALRQADTGVYVLLFA